MKTTTIYIASSWKNQHAVEMLTGILRAHCFHVDSWIENNYGEGIDPKQPFEDWVHTDAAQAAFIYDTNAAMKADIVIYLGPAGKDAAAEVAMAYALGKADIIGLWAKGEDIGLMRKMFSQWFFRHQELVRYICDNYFLVPVKGSRKRQNVAL